MILNAPACTVVLKHLIEEEVPTVKIHGATFHTDLGAGPSLPATATVKILCCIARKAPTAIPLRWYGDFLGFNTKDTEITSTLSSIALKNASTMSSNPIS